MRSSEMVFLDVEAAAARPPGRRWWLLEFGAIVVCPRRLVEVGSYQTLIRPGDPSAASRRFEDARAAPAFEEVADAVFEVLDGRVWAGHNIQRFDCPRIREAFADVGRAAPEPAAVVDSLNLLAHAFGRRAGDLKMATLASYFRIGKQKHRSLDDARMNLEVLKHCATVLLLESSLPDVLCSKANYDLNSGGAVTRSRRRAHDRMAMNPVMSTSPAAAAAAAGKNPISIDGSSCKRDSLGKLKAPKAVSPPLRLSGGGRRTTTTPPPAAFQMILRHSRAILR